MISKYINNIKKVAQPDNCIIDEIAQINIHRVFYLSIISIPIRLFTIINFINKSTAGDEKEIKWQIGIIISHMVFLVLLIILGSISYKLKKKNKPNSVTVAVIYAMVITILLISVVITVIDQLVTYSITPFIIACVAIGAVFLIKPLHSLLIFLLGYVVYYFAMGTMQLELSVLLSNRVNGLTSIILGVFLSFTLWRSNVINLNQKEHIKRQQKELEDKNKELESLATYDSLTGLINRRCFEEKISIEMSRIKNHDKKSCLLILDIDNFKSINDKYGHPTGDVILEGFALLLKKQLRETDIIARIGGEEFAILLINADEEIGKVVAQKIRKSIEKELFIIDGHEVNITVSIGITVLDSRTDSYEEGYKYADRALYRAKAEGKNKIYMELK
jgi:diguanylate cyclase (GGDEF)-like protein